MLEVALVIFVLAAILFGLSIVFWVLGCKKWCRGNNSVTDTNESRQIITPLQPTLKLRLESTNLEESGHYVEFGESLDARIDKERNQTANEGNDSVKTCDGSRMSQTEAPPPLPQAKAPPLQQTEAPPLPKANATPLPHAKAASIPQTKAPPIPQTKAPPIQQTNVPPLPGRRTNRDRATKHNENKTDSTNTLSIDKSSPAIDEHAEICDENDNKITTATVDTDQAYEVMDGETNENDNETKSCRKKVIVDTDQEYEIMDGKRDKNDVAKTLTEETNETYEIMDGAILRDADNVTLRDADNVTLRDADKVKLRDTGDVKMREAEVKLRDAGDVKMRDADNVKLRDADDAKIRDADQGSLGFGQEVYEEQISVESSDAESEAYVDMDAQLG